MLHSSASPLQDSHTPVTLSTDQYANPVSTSNINHCQEDASFYDAASAAQRKASAVQAQKDEDQQITVMLWLRVHPGTVNSPLFD